MEKRVMGVILSLLGIGGIIWAGIIFMNYGGGERNTEGMIFAGLIGGIFFFSGIGLIRAAKGRAT